jgi:hypothetical protein
MASSKTMSAEAFGSLIELAFRPFLSELGFMIQPSQVSGRCYRATFVEARHTLVIAFEPGDEHVTIMLFTNHDDSLMAIDDPENTLRLTDLNARYQPKTTASARAENEVHFSQIEQTDPVGKLLLKYAKELRLVLPLHLERPAVDMNAFQRNIHES